MSTAAQIQERNRELARAINEETLRNPQAPYSGKFVGIANGQVVAVADDLDTLARRLEEIEPDPSKTVWIEASRDYNIVEDIRSPI
jgi:hypothetical protein